MIDPGSVEHVPSRLRAPRAVLAVVVTVLLVAAGPWPTSPGAAVAQDTADAARAAALEIQAARDRANAAADALFDAQSELEVLEDQTLRVEHQVGQLEQRVALLQRDVESLALARFAMSGANGIPLLTGVQAPNDQVQAEVLTDVVANVGNRAIDDFVAVQRDLAAARAELVRHRSDVEDRAANFEELRVEADTEVERLRAIEAQRLTDEAVRTALAEQQAAAAALVEEAQRQNAEAAARAQPNPGVATASAPASRVDPVDLGAAVVVPSAGASGAAVGGRTGTGGAGSAPAPPVFNSSTNGGATGSGIAYVDSILCPMPGSAYGDTWGAPRSGGRLHQGVDMLAPIGVPIYAVVAGTVSFGQNRLGGNAASLIGDNGNRYYYAHLSSFEGEGRRVAQGDVIGYNGDTGNARGTPHLHFEIHPGRGLAVNPTPSVRAAGC
jgi:murein DD-endopeptidase MepM/ murein hydrolase activator NlpD